MRYRVTKIVKNTVEVEAGNKQEATRKADKEVWNWLKADKDYKTQRI